MEVIKLLENGPNTRPLQCNWQSCTKGFSRKSDLQRHYRTHTNERPYSCTYHGCGKRFIQNSALTVHIRTHTGEKPHKCQNPGCKQRFSDVSSLARHRRIHTSKCPYECSHKRCLKNLYKESTVVKHQPQCYQQGKSFDNITDSYSSNFDSNEPPSIPEACTFICSYQDIDSINSRTQGLPHRVSSFPEFRQQINDCPLQQNQQYLSHCTIPSSNPARFQAQNATEQQTSINMMYQEPRAAPQVHYISDQASAGILTMIINPIQPQHHVHQQRVERSSSDMPYSTFGMASSTYLSPGTVSATSIQSSPLQNKDFYSNHRQSVSILPAVSLVDFHHSLPSYAHSRLQTVSEASQPTINSQAQTNLGTGSHDQTISQQDDRWF